MKYKLQEVGGQGITLKDAYALHRIIQLQNISFKCDLNTTSYMLGKIKDEATKKTHTQNSNGELTN